MKIDQKVIDRFNLIIQEGQRLNSIPQHVGDHVIDTSLHEFASKFKMDGLFILNQIFTKDSDLYINFNKPYIGPIYNFSFYLGILKSAKELYEQGHLFDIQQRITADVFNDFLERAEYLLASGDYQAAAVVAGCVLEDAVRKMCERPPAIELDEKASFDTMNGKLCKRGDYPDFIRALNSSSYALRSKAAHGKWDEFTKDDVKKMIPDVRDFMVKYFV